MGIERRQAPRETANGPVRLELGPPLRRVIEGQLVDVSATGFRVDHSDAGLASGDRVHYSHERGSGQAQVVWTRIVGGKISSGFLVTSQS